MNFRKWFEDNQSQVIGARETILGFLRPLLHIRDDETILNMNTADMDQSVTSKLLTLGLVSTSSPDIINQIKNGIAIQDLIDALANSTATAPMSNQ